MQKYFQILALFCGAIVCFSCSTHVNNEYSTSSRMPDYKNEKSAPKQYCLNAAHPYADIGPSPGLPPLSQVPASMWKKLPITKDGKSL